MAETLIPIGGAGRRSGARPGWSRPPERGLVGKLALVLAVFALAVACLALVVGHCRRGRMTHRSQGREQSPLPSPTGTGSSPSWKGWR